MVQLKEDLHCTSAELVNGTILRPLGEFFDERKAEATSNPNMLCHQTEEHDVYHASSHYTNL